jgi:1,4-alpha-glucan branching enzyme
MHAGDCDPAGFRWLEANDVENSTYAFVRSNPAASDDAPVVVVLNFTPVVRHNYRLGVPRPGRWRELLNSDGMEYGGSGVGNGGAVEADPVAGHGEYQSLNLTIPPLGALFLVPDD